MMIDKDQLGDIFGRIGMGNQSTLWVMGTNRDVCVGEVFAIHSNREGHERVFFYRVLEMENYLRRIEDLTGVASTLMVEGDSYLSGIDRNKLIAIGGKMLGYAEPREDENGNIKWVFKSPRRLPEHLAFVYRPKKGVSDTLYREMLESQTGGEIYVGDFQIGEDTLDVPICIDAKFLPMHLAIFGSTGAGKSNLMMVLIKSIIDNNLRVERGDAPGPKVSAFCIDPHDEFAKGVDTYGIQSIVEEMDVSTRKSVFGDFYYLTTHLGATPREIRRYAREIRIRWAEIKPRDLYSIMEFTPQMMAFIDNRYNSYGENWVQGILDLDEDDPSVDRSNLGVLRAVKRRLKFLQNSRIFIDSGQSILPDIFRAMETGRILVVNTSLMSDQEQFLLTTIVTRTLSDLRRAVKSSGLIKDFDEQCNIRIPRSLYSKISQEAKAFYGKGGSIDDNIELKDPRELPIMLITVEEAPSILNPALMEGQSVFKDISRQGRKFNIGLLVVSQQVSVLDNVILSQTNTQINLRLGNEKEIRACIENASVNISGFEGEFRVMSRGEALLTASYRDMPLPVRIPLFDDIFERDRGIYKNTKATKRVKHRI